MFTTNSALAESEDVTFCFYNTPAFGRIMAPPEPHRRANIVRLERISISKQVRVDSGRGQDSTLSPNPPTGCGWAGQT